MSEAERQSEVDLAHESDFKLGALEVRPSSRSIVSAGSSELLEPRVMQVLVALARRRGEVVSRDELVKECWAGRVVGDDAISRCVIRLRRLAEAHGGFTVETIPRVGYRLSEKKAEIKIEPLAAQRSELPESGARIPIAPSVRQRSWMIAMLAVLVVSAVLFGLAQHRTSNNRSALQTQIIDQVGDLVAKDQFTRAFTAARPLLQDEDVKRQPKFAAAWAQIILPMRPLVAEAGATVYFKSYDDVDGEWLKAGTSPIATMIDAPFGTLRIKIEKPGFRTGYFAVANPGPSVMTEHPTQKFVERNGGSVPLPLVADDAIPKGMVAVPRTDVPVWLARWALKREGDFRFDIPAFAIGRFEVTNQEFKEFIDAGGYDESKFWAGLKFEDQGRELSFAEARKRFVDSTNRIGPAEWQLSTYPSGKGDFPVSGISWYEAMAYARFRGESLPTIHHWMRAAFAPFDPRFNASPAIALLSGFLTDGPVAATSEVGLGPWGTYHMAGNVREWVLNFTDNQAIALGGTWTDYAAEIREIYSTSPMQRVPTIGFRLMRAEADSNADELRKPIALIRDDLQQRRDPVSNDAFEAMRFQFPAARAKPISVTVESIRETPLWVAEEVSLKFPLDQMATLYVVRPKSQSKPLEPIIYSPSADCCVTKRPNREALEQLIKTEFIPNSGRALVIPIWLGSYERVQSAEMDPKAFKDRERRNALAWQQDLSIALDYLETRNDIDMSKAGYLGISRGAAYTSIVLAIEPRVKAAVLVSGGIVADEAPHPMMDLVNYAPRIKIPVLMINGRFDHLYSYERSQKRLFDLLGTPAAQKSQGLYDAGHFQYPLNSLARDASNWFDKYLGPTR